MNKRLAALLLLVALLLAAILLPENGRVQSHSVVHQHEVWPQESEAATGFDEFGNLTTHLPLLIVQVDGREIPGIRRETDEKLICDYAIIDNPNGMNRSNGVPTQTGTMAISIRGNSSRAFPKKQYAVKLVDQEGMPEEQSLLGMPAESTWVLNGSFIDHSQIRNYMLYNISGEIMDYAPRCRLCEVMFTDESGHVMYQGLYTLIEKPKMSENRLNLTQYDPKYAETAFLCHTNKTVDGIEITHIMRDDHFLYSSDLVYPSPEDVTDNSIAYIQRKVLTFEKALFDAAYTNDWVKVEQTIDWVSFVDYYIINEFFQNFDAGRISTYYYCDIGGKWHMGPVWDFDAAMNNFIRIEFETDQMMVKDQSFYYYLFTCPKFLSLCADRYTQLRNTVLSDEYLLDYIDSTCAYLGSAALRNCDKWYGNDYDLYYKEIEKMKDLVTARGQWMDSHFADQIQLVISKG